MLPFSDDYPPKCYSLSDSSNYLRHNDVRPLLKPTAEKLNIRVRTEKSSATISDEFPSGT